ncbi:hypothetical protein SS50377_23365 [Spironucleus salmonicida]|uniref:Uncharacterized protein n=1 Tax=Spironucleus salmonicida TaxID=348837 RepID=V6LU65_9EUKA|nr:hypothetical protein SS50377_23365 [Spironucleus salmonicida]|eukprot:EST47236.1 Hypothetical protein SS50377_12746 [Spironucleus salmonicida]
MGKRKNWTDDEWRQFFANEVQKYEKQLEDANLQQDHSLINQLKGSIKRVQNNELQKFGQPITKEIKRRERIKLEKSPEQQELDKVKVQEYWERKQKRRDQSNENHRNVNDKQESERGDVQKLKFLKNPEQY